MRVSQWICSLLLCSATAATLPAQGPGEADSSTFGIRTTILGMAYLENPEVAGVFFAPVSYLRKGRHEAALGVNLLFETAGSPTQVPFIGLQGSYRYLTGVALGGGQLFLQYRFLVNTVEYWRRNETGIYRRVDFFFFSNMLGVGMQHTLGKCADLHYGLGAGFRDNYSNFDGLIFQHPVGVAEVGVSFRLGAF